MLLTLMLSKQEINVQLLESSDKISSQPRAAYYGLPAAYELRRAGIAEDVSNIGFLPKRVCWRKPNGVRIAGLKGDDIDESYPDKMLCLPLDRLCGILERHIKEQATAEICWNCKVVKVGQDEDKAWVDVETPEGEKRLEADYIAGCDGATSQVRRCILGDRSFPGSTWEKQIIATNVTISSSPLKLIF